jgi:hypothetical protein
MNLFLNQKKLESSALESIDLESDESFRIVPAAELQYVRPGRGLRRLPFYVGYIIGFISKACFLP